MLISFMSFIVKAQDLAQVHLGEEGKHQDMLTHGHMIELFIPIYQEVKKIYRDHSYHPKLPLHSIAIPIYITQHLALSFLDDISALHASGFCHDLCHMHHTLQFKCHPLYQVHLVGP